MAASGKLQRAITISLWLLILVPFLVLVLPVYIVYKLFLSLLPSDENIMNKVVLITGASSGVGEQLSYEYAKKGARLVLCARREQLLKEVAMNSQNLGSPEVLVIPADVSKLEDCKDMVEKTITRFGRLDHLVVNAGFGGSCLFEDIENISGFKDMMDVNFWGSVYPTHYSIPHLQKSKGKIIVNASVAGLIPSPTATIYCASKAAVMRFYEALRAEVGSDVDVTIVALGRVGTAISKGKVMTKAGKIIDNHKLPEIYEAQPEESVEECAKAILRAACRGKRLLIWPTWYSLLFLTFALLPEANEWLAHRYVVGRD